MLTYADVCRWLAWLRVTQQVYAEVQAADGRRRRSCMQQSVGEGACQAEAKLGSLRHGVYWWIAHRTRSVSTVSVSSSELSSEAASIAGAEEDARCIVQCADARDVGERRAANITAPAVKFHSVVND
jgi:hypothetical protein